jgi:thioredoxin 1
MLAITERSTSAMNMRPTIEIDEANFETEVLKSSQPVLVEFATGWSLPSVMLDGALDEIAAEFVDRLKVARVKLDYSPNLGLWYGIRCIPTILCFVDGEERVGIFGTTSKETILSQLKTVINSQRMTKNVPPTAQVEAAAEKSETEVVSVTDSHAQSAFSQG